MIVRAHCLGSANAWSLWRTRRTGPNRGCCSGLSHVLNRSVTCLCKAIREGAKLGVPVNVTKAFALPSLCGFSHTQIRSIAGESEDRFGVNERKEVIGLERSVGNQRSCDEKELDVDNGGKGNVEMGIRLPDVGSAIKMRME
ncbi:uncharacterized protein LOC109705908 [Ananas comosus]|uniref:Uncharacterized protein LOC109705908 n=1 Tax=Ananas comosus TaxID=4615 RepID=A0A6P5EG57_ANACO|nr:uncharacterized protein LOC109705908 [Ananas comosus]